jgi:hypothetical protein
MLPVLDSLLSKSLAYLSVLPKSVCLMTEHEINLTDDKPYREPYRRIPPSMFDEVREHLRVMLEVGYQVFFLNVTCIGFFTF